MISKDSYWLRNLKKLMWFAAILSSCAGWVTEAAASKSFFCKATIAAIGDPAPTSLSGPLVYDMGQTGSCTDLDYSLHFHPNCASPAASACSSVASGDSSFNSAAFWCAKGVPNGSTIRAYSAVGPAVVPKGRYATAQTKGVLINKPAVTNTTYDCNNAPGTWLDPPAWTNGNHGRCVKNACNAVSGVPAAPNWTYIGAPWTSNQTGTWITDASGNVWYGVLANATTVVVTPAECRWQ